jgi:hypothetical protein
MGRLQHLSLLLLKKNSFTWTPAAAQAFQTLNMAMCTTPVLALPDFTKTFVLECDALGKGIGVVLMQEGRPLAFTSKKLSERNLGKSIYEKEMLAILHVVDLWHPYLLGKRFQIKTDHQSLKYFLEQCISSPEQQKWVTKLFGYDYEIIYKKGKDNVVADALSQKYEDEGSLFSLSFIVPRLAPSHSPGMATRSQKFVVDPTIAVQCSSFPRVLLAP